MSFTLKDSIGPTGLAKGRAEAALAGQTLANRYDVLELLGTGGMGAVYRARDRELDDIVALKVIRKELAAEAAMVERFRHEVKLARRVTHVNVARTFELGTVDGLMYCTMELVDGQALSARLQQRSKLQVGEAVAIACAVCDGLAAAHAANVIHRDIKPDNILLASDGRVVLADFGVAAAGVGAAGELSGTPAYMAPEQARGESPRPAADVYAVGVVLAEMLSGRCPFSGDALAIIDEKQRLERVVLTEVPPELAVVVGQATARDVDTRIQSATALRRALEPWARGMTRMPTQPQRSATDSTELTTVVVVAPASKSDRQYIAEAVHEQLLARLVRTPRLRVLPRAAAVAGAIHVTYAVGETLAATIGLPDGDAFVLQFPLTFAHVGVASDAIFETIEGEVARQAEHADTRSQAIELFLRARHQIQRDITKMPQVLDLLGQARELAPQEPRILAGTAIAFVRTAFFLPDYMPDALERGRELAYASVVAAPDLADAHIAVGHVELGLGNGVLAATHFRTAIRCAPHLAEAHEQLGRLLLEAGYLDAAVARLEEAIAIAPELRSARWEIARSLALEGKWDELETFWSELVRSVGADRPLARSRYAWWRRDVAELQRLRTRSAGALDRALHPGLLDALFSVFLDDNGWADRREFLLSVAQVDHPNRRRVTFIHQMIIEAAAASLDHDVAFSLLSRATDRGLFDRHWLEKCPLLEPLRSEPHYPAIYQRIRERADAIHDALHGDNAALSETAIA